MNNIRDIHREAMSIADQAFINRRNGDDENARNLFENAFRLELEAAEYSNREPSRSILYRSAATLALHAQLYREAEKAVAVALAGDPSPEIANELREVFEKANFQRHLSLQGVVLSSNELQMTITGNAISPGMALTDVVFDRIQNFEKLIIRTAQRINNKPFGKITKSKTYNLYMSIPRAGSFAVTLLVGEPSSQMFPEVDNTPQIIDEVMFNLTLLNESRVDELRDVIQDKNYYDSFVGIAKKIVPDGDEVKMVGVTALRSGVETSIGLSVTPRQIKPILDIEIRNELIEKESSEVIQITGELFFAEAQRKNRIKVTDDNGKSHEIEVTAGIAEDVVKPYFGSRVTVDVVQHGKRLQFFDINSAEI